MTTLLRFLLLASFAASPLLAQDERILSFDSDVKIAVSEELTITETIRVRSAGLAIQRGIYRDFPTLYRGSGGLRLSVPFEVLSVKRDGQNEPYTDEFLVNGRRIRIGQASVLLPPGDHTYEITYRTSEQLGRFPNHDELYWNVTGNGWDFPIDQTTARITLPGGTRPLSHEAYTGPQGAKGQDYRSSETAPGVVTFATTATLPPQNGLTIVVTWPKGVLAPLPPQNLTQRYLRDNVGVFSGGLGLAVLLIYYGSVWLAVGKDPQKGTIIPRYEPPQGFSPAAARYLRLMGFDDGAFTAAIISLAAKGILTIEKEGSIYVLTSTGNDAPDRTTQDERILAKKLFELGPTLRLEQANHSRLNGAKQALTSSLALVLETHYFLRNTGFWILGLLVSTIPVVISLAAARAALPIVFILLWLLIWSIVVGAMISATISAFTSGRTLQGIGIGAFSLPFLFGEIAGLGMLWAVAGGLVVAIFVITLLSHAAFYHLLKRPTLVGQKTLDEIEGFREYLTVAEEERLNLLNPPDRTPELFERFLPFAFALDAEQAWSRAFDAILAQASQGADGYHPTWYHAGANSFSASSFSQQLTSAFAGAVSSASTAPGSSSGSGGGGSSGGGGGGGGGGGW